VYRWHVGAAAAASTPALFFRRPPRSRAAAGSEGLPPPAAAVSAPRELVTSRDGVWALLVARAATAATAGARGAGRAEGTGSKDSNGSTGSNGSNGSDGMDHEFDELTLHHTTSKKTVGWLAVATCFVSGGGGGGGTLPKTTAVAAKPAEADPPPLSSPSPSGSPCLFVVTTRDAFAVDLAALARTLDAATRPPPPPTAQPTPDYVAVRSPLPPALADSLAVARSQSPGAGGADATRGAETGAARSASAPPLLLCAVPASVAATTTVDWQSQLALPEPGPRNGPFERMSPALALAVTHDGIAHVLCMSTTRDSTATRPAVHPACQYTPVRVCDGPVHGARISGEDSVVGESGDESALLLLMSGEPDRRVVYRIPVVRLLAEMLALDSDVSCPAAGKSS
jgi:hypothetical protein